MSEDNTERRPLVNLRVNVRQKARWERFAEQSNQYSSLSHLIRVAVEKEMNQDSLEQPTEVEIPGEYENKLNEIMQGIDRLQQDVSWLRSKEEHDIEELAHQLFNSLEPVPADGSDESAAAMGTIAGLDPQTVDALSKRLNTTPARVEEAIEFLKDQHMPIIQFDIEGETHWFKEE